MRRHSVSKPWRWFWSVLLFCMVAATLLDITVRADAIPNPQDTNVSAATAPVKLTYTGETWFGKPVFALTNRSNSVVMDKIALRSWSRELVPVIAIGLSKPEEWPKSSEELPSPPFQLQPHATLWFVGPKIPPTSLYLYWTDNRGPVHEVLHVSN